MAKKKINPRYIDANLVKDALLGWDEDPSDEDIEYAIDNIPTADVVEVKHGEWKGKPIAGYSDIKCSVCGCVFLHKSGLWRYCPDCGAKMDGGKAE